ncbi:MAG: RNA polymerase sigma factor [Mangrovibacterium sp.]
MQKKISDLELLESLKDRDKQAFRQLYDRYARLLDNRAKWRVRDMVMAEDLMQEFWIKVWEEPFKIQLDEDGTAKNYLLKAFTGYQLNYIRKEIIRLQKAERFESKEDPDPASSAVLREVNHVAETDSFLDQYELEELINWYFDMLPELTQQILRMRYLEKYSYKEISQKLRLNERTVRYKEKEGLVILKSKMKDERLGELLYSIIVMLTTSI